ncbi:deoxyribonuclease IV [Jeotgalibacillus proteolyticus]|uniref:Endonuclease IV n=1 Tax=Jeotgalibacillus proteolyticus TaxID=2082395 RepID=A0A2S5G7U4_9BACL|nr:deoxyribonuclease IV [Jeotgalibacillus proteolyticus]PPA69067.1 endonuclease IV [Jeotgalibacillus proteolyticus]
MIIGSHVSIREGYTGAARKAAALHANAFQYFPKNPRSLIVKEFDKEDAGQCQEFCTKNKLVSVAHTPYPTTLTPSSDSKRELVVASLLNDLEIADACGSLGVVVHFGKDIFHSDQLKSYRLMIDVLNNVLSEWQGKCKILLENMAGKPGAMGTTLEELVQLRALCETPLKIGFCFDTCHAFASGLWDGNNWAEVEANGVKLGYLDHLAVVHLNNSMYESGSGKDRHANIFGQGYIKEEQFDQLITSKRLKPIPFILETPKAIVSHEMEIRQLQKKWGREK